MKQIVRGVLLVGAMSTMLAGCNSVPLDREPVSEDQQIGAVLLKVRDSMALAANAQQELALTSDAKLQAETALRRRLLTDVVNYDYYGDVEGILKEIALKYGYEFEKYGKRPPEGLMVNVFVSKKPVIEVLRQIGYTSNSALDIELKRTVIELHYKSR